MTTQGKRLKKIRLALGLSGEDFGKKIGVSKQYISNLEADRNILNNEKLVSLLVDFNVNLNYLIAGKGEIFINECENTHTLVDNPKCTTCFKSWGERLCNLLAENNITPRSFAKLAGISASRMDDFIINSTEPTISELNAIKSKADISIDELLYGESVNQQGNNQQAQFTQEEILKLKKLIGS